jgi:TonB-dependent SusC/RagA subfamily outer membrane receptor
MSVLKDATSLAAYGSQAANGVSMITTKKAKAGDAVVSIDAKVGVNTKALQNYERITDPAQYYEAYYSSLYWYHRNLGESHEQAHLAAAVTTPGTIKDGGLGVNVYTLPEGELLIGSNGKLNPSATLGRIVENNGQKYLLTPDDWMDEAYRASIRQEYNVSVSGTSGKASFLGSFGYLNDKGIIAGADMKRYTARLKADYQAKSWLKVYGNLAYTRYDSNSLGNNGTSNSTANIWAFTSQVAPIYPLWVRTADKKVKHDQWGFEMMDYGDGMNGGLSRPFMTNANPLFANRVNTRHTEGNAINAYGAADITFLKYFKFTFNASENIDEYRYTSVQNPYYGQFASSKGSVSKQHARSAAFNTQQILNYNQSFGELNVGVMLGHEYYNLKSYSLSASKQNMYSQDNKELDGAVKDNSAAGSSMGEYNVEGYFTRAQADYQSKYFASASFRRDASSHFAVPRRLLTS